MIQKILRLFGLVSCLLALVCSVVFREGLVSNPLGQFSGFPLNHQHTGWGTSRYYPNIDPTAKPTQEVRVAIIDSGIREEAVDEFYVEDMQVFSTSTSVFDTIGHGTKIASIIGAKNNHVLTLGLSPEARLFSYKVTDDDGTIKNDYLVKAVQQAIEDHVDVVNLSMVVTNPSKELEDVVEAYLQQGGYMVVPAYDLKKVEALNPLLTIEGVVSVGTYNEFFTLLNPQEEIAYYAPYSQETLSMENRIVRSEGSSFSTAFVSGTIAHLLSVGQTDAEITKQLDDFFSARSVKSKQSPLLAGYETHQALVNNSYTVLSLSLIGLLVFQTILGILTARKESEVRGAYMRYIVVTDVLLVILALLILPTQM
ncbi:TPA: S8/S53 family peptidase [Streptococcus suis]|nr:S8/S53 family peptidase [Streptococcus suis]